MYVHIHSIILYPRVNGVRFNGLIEAKGTVKSIDCCAVLEIKRVRSDNRNKWLNMQHLPKNLRAIIHRQHYRECTGLALNPKMNAWKGRNASAPRSIRPSSNLFSAETMWKSLVEAGKTEQNKEKRLIKKWERESMPNGSALLNNLGTAFWALT